MFLIIMWSELDCFNDVMGKVMNIWIIRLIIFIGGIGLAIWHKEFGGGILLTTAFLLGFTAFGDILD